MRKHLIVGLLGGMLMGGSLLAATFDGTIKIDYTGVNGGLHGGEFLATLGTGQQFLTFCLELDEHVSYGVVYDYNVNPNNAAVLGGKNHDPSTPGYDIISQGTALLYQQFRERTLPKFSDPSTDAGELQKAIWALEDEMTFAEAGGTANPYLDLVTKPVVDGGFGSFDSAQANYTGDVVKVFNLFDPNNSDGHDPRDPNRQDVLWAPGLPDGGLTLCMLGMGLTGLGIVSRRLRK